MERSRGLLPTNIFGAISKFLLAVLTTSCVSLERQAYAELQDRASSGRAIASAGAWPASWQEDARINRLHFVNRFEGWAVGERGVVWKTHDGGLHWQRMPSAISESLSDVFFLDAQHGWMTAASVMPYAQTSRGVVLRTSDGGKTWARNHSTGLPAVFHIRFVDRRHGVATCRATGLFPAGLMMTRDGGHTWDPMPVDPEQRRTLRGTHWVAIEPGTAGELWCLGASGEVVVWDGQSAQDRSPAVLTDGTPGLAHVFQPDHRALLIAPGQRLFAAPRASNWMWARDPGRSPSPWDAAHALAGHGQHGWVTGSPAGIIWHSPDAGKHWEPRSSGCRAPLHAMFFLDEQTGWAAGSGGTIVATRDGGRTWSVQRSATDRAALCIIAPTANDIPWEVLADAAAVHGYRVHVTVMGTPSGRSSADAAWHQFCTDQAVIAAGGMGAITWWEFPLPDNQLRLSPFVTEKQWRQLHDRCWLASTGIGRLEQRLRHTIDDLRPDVVYIAARREDLGKSFNAGSTNHAHRGTRIGALLCDAGCAVAEQMQRTGGGLRVVVDRGDVGTSHGLSLDLDAYLPVRETTADQVATHARSLVATRYRPLRVEYRLQQEWPVRAPVGQSLFQGLSLPHDSPARRPREAIRGDTQTLERVVQRRRNVEAVIQAAATDESPQRLGWLSRLQALSQEFDESSEAQLQFQSAEQLWEVGRIEEASEVLLGLLPDGRPFPLRDAVVERVMARQTSKELEVWQAAMRSQTIVPNTVATDVRQAGHETPVETSDWVSVLESSNPELPFDPGWMMAIAARKRAADDVADVARRLRRVEHMTPVGSVWHRRAQDELRLLDRQELEHGSLVQCHGSDTRPYLDGQLRDATWEVAPLITMTGVDGREFQDKSEVRHGELALWLAYDDEYLFMAARATGLRSEEDVASREALPLVRGGELTGNLHLVVEFDTNRDYASAWQFAFDERGTIVDACLDNTRWDPQWYAAEAITDDGAWVMEAAIPWSQLVPEPPVAGDVWRIGVRRVLTGIAQDDWPPPVGSGKAGGGAPEANFPQNSMAAERPRSGYLRFVR